MKKKAETATREGYYKAEDLKLLAQSLEIQNRSEALYRSEALWHAAQYGYDKCVQRLIDVADT